MGGKLKRKHWWPSQRGDVSCGGSSKFSVPLDWSRVWKIDATGAQNSVLIDDKGRIYITHPTNIRQYDDFGLIAWQQDTNEGFMANPCLVNDSIIVATCTGFAKSFSLDDGTLQWSQKYCKSTAWDPFSIVEENNVVILAGKETDFSQFDTFNDYVYALDAASGAMLWKSQIPIGTLMFAPVLTDTCVFYQNMFGCIICLNVKNGSPNWKVEERQGTTTGGVTICTKKGLLFSTSNRRGKKMDNAPFGGKGQIRAFSMDTGEKKWENLYDLEANSLPSVAAVNDRWLLAVGLSANIGTAEKSLGSHWPAKFVVLDALDGTQLWCSDSVWDYSIAKGGPQSKKGNHYQPPAFAPPTFTANGRVIFSWNCAGLCVNTDARTGTAGSSTYFIFSHACTQASPAVGEDMLVVQSYQHFIVFKKNPCPSRKKIYLPLVKPLSESGTEHWWESKVKTLNHTECSPFVGPTDISKPTWEHAKLHGHWARRPGLSYFHKTAVVDSQRNIYIGNNDGFLWVFRPNGAPRGWVEIGPCLCNPALDGNSVYACNSLGYAVSVDIETLEYNWYEKYAIEAGADSWSPAVCKGTLVCCGCEPPGQTLGQGGNSHIYGLNTADGQKLWAFSIGHLSYNLLTSIYEAEDRVLFADQSGGLYCIKLSDGKLLWAKAHEVNDHRMTTGHCACAPNLKVYNEWNEGYNAFNNPSGYANVAGYSVMTGEKLWHRVWDGGYGGHVAPVACLQPTGKHTIVACLGDNPGYSPVEFNGGDYNTRLGGGLWKAKIVGLHEDTGDTLWELQLPDYHSWVARGSHINDMFLPDAFGSPTVDANGNVYVCFVSGHLYCFQSSDGKLLSKCDMGWSSQAAPVILPGVVIVATCLKVILWKDNAVEDTWCEKARVAGDPRADPVFFDMQEPTAQDQANEEEMLHEALQLRASCKAHKQPFEPLEHPMPEGDGYQEAVNLLTDAGLKYHWELGPDGKLIPEELRDWGVKERIRREQLRAELREKGKEVNGQNMQELYNSKSEMLAAAEAERKAREAEDSGNSNPVANSERRLSEDGKVIWTVIGGGTTGGIMVRNGEGLKTKELGRLGTGARVEEIELVGDRLHYHKLDGDGPDFGWVSLHFKGKDLLSKA